MAGIGLYFFSQHIDSKAASPAEAARDFEQVTIRFTGQKPLIELDDRGRYLRSHTDRQPVPNAKAPDELHVMAFDPDEGRHRAREHPVLAASDEDGRVGY